MKYCDKCGVYYRAEHECGDNIWTTACDVCGMEIKHFDFETASSAIQRHKAGQYCLPARNSKDDGGEYTGGSVSYYRVKVEAPTTAPLPYTAECNDIIEALDMNYAEGNAFKALWRRAAARKGMVKRGYTDGVYDAEKVEFFGHRLVVQERNK